MAGQTITQKILARAANRDRVEPGETIDARIDTLMMHDVTSDRAIDLLNEEFDGNVAEDLEVIVTPDHFVPAKDIASAKLYQNLKRFVKEQERRGADVTAYMVEGGDYGVCHVMLPEKGHVTPGRVIVGGDSHTCTYGALGAFSTGIGTTEAGNVLATGRLWFRVPETMMINVHGVMPINVMAKDLFLRVVGVIGVDGALYQAMEWGGSTIRRMGMDERMTLTNMAIEAGAKSGIIEPDDMTIKYLQFIGLERVDEATMDSLLEREDPRVKRTFCPENWDFKCDSDADYSSFLSYSARELVPLVATPHLPSNVKPASELHDVRIDQAYIGGCTGGKWNDFVAAANVLNGRRVADNVRLLVVPSTADIQDKLIRNGLYDIFRDAGAVFSAPTCGACLGGYMGILAPGERCITTTNRNFRGRMGSPESEVYLASPQTVAASAIAGHIQEAER